MNGHVWSSFVAVMTKEFKHIFRDRGTLALFFTLPVMQLALFGFLDQNVRDLPTVVVDQDQTSYSRELMDQMRATRTFEITRVTDSPDEARALIAQGRVRVGVIVPPDFHDHRAHGDNAQFLVLIDGSDSTVSAQALAAINGLVAQDNLDAAAALGAHPVVSAQPIILFNPEGRTANYIIPGLIAILLQLAAMILAAISIVREREQGTMEQLLVTPIHPIGLVLGKLMPYLVIGIAEMALILTIMRFGFAVPIEGSLIFLFLTAVVYLFALLALGLTISMRAQTQIAATQMAQMLLLPSIFLSGYIFPVAGLPRVLYWIGRLLPATHMIDIMRGAVLRSAGPFDLLPSILALLAISVVLVTISVRRVRKLTM
ncbi:MAG TPA: ABC transporter permease [Kofleriaceae bacterium]|nr:ABC transporter permease [Kofleriaceae bacterium]